MVDFRITQILPMQPPKSGPRFYPRYIPDESPINRDKRDSDKPRAGGCTTYQGDFGVIWRWLLISLIHHKRKTAQSLM